MDERLESARNTKWEATRREDSSSLLGRFASSSPKVSMLSLGELMLLLRKVV
jgi:hypothetical protein